MYALLPPDRRSAVPRRALWDLYQAHFSMDAQPLNLVRPEVPVELAALVAKMMAKEPVTSVPNVRRSRAGADALLQKEGVAFVEVKWAILQATSPEIQQSTTGTGSTKAEWGASLRSASTSARDQIEEEVNKGPILENLVDLKEQDPLFGKMLDRTWPGPPRKRIGGAAVLRGRPRGRGSGVACGQLPVCCSWPWCLRSPPSSGSKRRAG